MKGVGQSTRRVVVGEILELEDLREGVTAQDWSEAMQFSSMKRQREYLSWRYVLRSALRAMADGVCQYASAPILYRASGAPYIDGLSLNFGVSHSRDMVAVVISNERCGVDIELIERKYTTIESRYLSGDELLLLSAISADDLNVGRAVAWSTKEAVYKYCETEGLDFVRDMRIVGVDVESRQLDVEVLSLRLIVDYEVHEKYVIVVV